MIGGYLGKRVAGFWSDGDPIYHHIQYFIPIVRNNLESFIASGVNRNLSGRDNGSSSAGGCINVINRPCAIIIPLLNNDPIFINIPII